MNRFRAKKKGKDELDAPRPSIESESSSPFRMFGKKKAPEEEPKKELDLATALPSTDDFRTSLLMTNLSARFSMLREQDDPNTKLGKASDDSVLFPNRQSRMMDFGFAAGLGDIAEVESVKAPFARSSVLSNDDTSSLNGSVMGRSKPIEGNNLFGGRQKVYKIGAGGNKGAMSGRVLYGDDVAQSAFQKWRQSEKDRQSFDDLQQSESLESEIERPESPSQTDYNHKRETNSTTSSGPYAARDSTAATSVSSSQKDRESFANTFRTTSPTPMAPPTVERTVTRTRRLYEQSLNQDQQDHQTSALSRFDTLSKRTIGSRTPDLTPPVPSPSSATFGDRFITRSVLGKASAPNLRSFSPPSESVNKFPNMDQKAFGATPPLSPPISETGEVQPLDRNMILSRNNSQYDESRFAQRQVQMQRGRETPTTGFRNDSNPSLSGPRSRSPSVQRPTAEKSDSGSFPTVQEESQSSTFFNDDDEDEMRSPNIITPQLNVEKPADIEHPALRHSAMPTPLIISDGPGDITSAKVNDLPHDSPTLGPTSGGLSGMVRQHLRSDSNASSIYGSMPNDADLSSRFPPERPDAHAFEPKTMDSNAWESIERDLAMSIDGSVTSPTRSSGLVEAQIMSSPEPVQEFKQDTRPQQQDETDEFARHLADGARRVRERLTSFVESDSGATVPEAPLSELPPPPRPNALGILKSKPSIGSMERGQGDREAVNQSKTKKLLGLRGSSPASAKVSPTRDTFDDRMPQSPEGMNDADTPRDSEEKEGVHAGLKAFRQARRDLQRMKELELQQRRQGPQSPPTSRDRAQTATSSRAPSQERSRPPPVSYNRMPSEEAGANGGSRAGSRAGSRSGSRAPSERDRSGSEASNGGRSGSRPPRVRAGSSARDDYQGPLGSPVGVNGKPRQGPMVRSPMMPGQEMRRSPHPQSQQPYPVNASSGRFGRSENSLHIHPAHGYDLGQPSPISPGAPSPKGFAGHGPGSQRPYGPGGMMRNRDMSEPSIKSSGSPMGYPRSGPAPLNGGTVSTPNLHGNVGAPPLPPINPRRKNTGVALGDATMNAHHLPSSPGIPIDQRGLRGEEEEGIGHYRQRLRKATSEANVNARARSMLQNPAPPMVPPPMPPSTSNNALPGGMI
ncbi:hypothetical protein FGSG_08325 [Fusarium graminearum PH-1]|uniref:Chromosome 2, complete genome n=1 Tax=Gibberella zeae (strain ATCC MYA-4620 / CBS 123657 / FGSC 9075 / NRRL 31084 / PH-1) TaxID=229533 RepID=I1RVP2_GIBZE|nr:hypothetical protein FGSG_08325 [Fusarium graminearum PH-1]ESU15039.1 hypothetical protein FGSG_08325 [Fusarium graminearum PH-1]CAF3486834.1 unnamed protein product [Fusarium graminearum]CEF76635.1 unnamed protein product [Fusarium graminearum]|eukprot:XP_011320464.1 hypothetical protein FGSG_08325 [Fusarium graminearum PH-1]